MSDDPYVYPGTGVLINRLGITDAAKLDRVERRLVAVRAEDGIPGGNFDLEHLRAIHGHLFQDVYDWAGEVRTVELAKGGHHFIVRQFIERGMGDVHRRLEQAGFLGGLSRAEFAQAAGEVMGNVNYVHPFREGNGRTQLCYLEQLADRAGHKVDLGKMDGPDWIAASRASHDGDSGPMGRTIRGIMTRSRGLSR